MHDRRLLIRTLITGPLSYLATILLDHLGSGSSLFRNSGTYLPGVLFGAIVMAPQLPEGPRRNARRAGIVLLSTGIYWAAVKLAMHLAVTVRLRETVSCAAAGVLGAVAVGVASYVALRLDAPGRRLARAAVIGGLSGILFGLNGTFHVPDALQPLVLILGFTAWQTGVGWSLYGKP